MKTKEILEKELEHGCIVDLNVDQRLSKGYEPSLTGHDILERMKSFPQEIERCLFSKSENYRILLAIKSGALLDQCFFVEKDASVNDFHCFSDLIRFLSTAEYDDVYHEGMKFDTWKLLSKDEVAFYEEIFYQPNQFVGETQKVSQCADGMTKREILNKIIRIVGFTDYIDDDYIPLFKSLLSSSDFVGKYDSSSASVLTSISRFWKIAEDAFPSSYGKENDFKSPKASIDPRRLRIEAIAKRELEKLNSSFSWASHIRNHSITSDMNCVRLEMAADYLERDPEDIDGLLAFLQFFEKKQNEPNNFGFILKNFMILAFLLRKKTPEEAADFIVKGSIYQSQSLDGALIRFEDWIEIIEFLEEYSDALFEWGYKAVTEGKQERH